MLVIAWSFVTLSDSRKEKFFLPIHLTLFKLGRFHNINNRMSQASKQPAQMVNKIQGVEVSQIVWKETISWHKVLWLIKTCLPRRKRNSQIPLFWWDCCLVVILFSLHPFSCLLYTPKLPIHKLWFQPVYVESILS